MARRLSTTLRTDDVDPQDRIEFWRHAMSQAFVPLTVSEHNPERFTGELSTEELGGVMVASLRSSPQRIRRPRQLIARDDQDLFQIAVARKGVAQLDQDGRQARLGPGDIVIYETARPFDWNLPTIWAADVFTVPRSEVPLTPAQSRLVTARPLSGETGLSGVLSRFLRDLADHMDEISTSRSRRLVAEITNLVLTLVSDHVDQRSLVGPAEQRQVLRTRIKTYIERHLHQANLSPASIAAAHHISLRYLHKLFEEEEISVSRYIRQQRLRRCARDLRDPRLANRPIAAIAARAGFADLSGFGRAFKASYGMTPREFRSGHSG